MKHQSELERSARENLEAGEYLVALDNLQELIAVDRVLAVNLYTTYRERGIYPKVEKSAEEVIRCARDHLLIPPNILAVFNKNIIRLLNKMAVFETKYHIKPCPSPTSANFLRTAQKIIAEEEEVRPKYLPSKIFDGMEKHIFESLSKIKGWKSLSSREKKIKAMRKYYRTDPEPFARWFKFVYNLIIEERNMGAETSRLIFEMHHKIFDKKD